MRTQLPNSRELVIFDNEDKRPPVVDRLSVGMVINKRSRETTFLYKQKMLQRIGSPWEPFTESVDPDSYGYFLQVA